MDDALMIIIEKFIISMDLLINSAEISGIICVTDRKFSQYHPRLLLDFHAITY